MFIANLPKSVDEEQLKSMFAPYGDIVRSKILVDHHSGISKGCGFILFSKTSEADWAIGGMVSRKKLAIRGLQLLLQKKKQPEHTTRTNTTTTNIITTNTTTTNNHNKNNNKHKHKHNNQKKRESITAEADAD